MCALLSTTIAPSRATAQTTLALRATTPGNCEVIVQVKHGRVGDAVGLRVAETVYRERRINGDDEQRFTLGEPLRAGFVVTSTLNGEDADSATVPSGARSDLASCAIAPTERHSVEPSLGVSTYFGRVYDNFAPDAVGDYRNLTSETTKSQYIFGFDFDYRLLGRANDDHAVWLRGETMHGVRTADVDCSNPDTSKQAPVCGDKDVANPTAARYILAHATSLEAFLSPRMDLFHLQTGSNAPTSVYAHATVGFLALNGAPELYFNYAGGLGLRVTDGDFAGTFFEAGLGKNDLFTGGGTRALADVMLTFDATRIPVVGQDLHFFGEATVDRGLRHQGPDAVRVFMGLDIDPRILFR